MPRVGQIEATTEDRYRAALAAVLRKIGVMTTSASVGDAYVLHLAALLTESTAFDYLLQNSRAFPLEHGPYDAEIPF